MATTHRGRDDRAPSVATTAAPTRHTADSANAPLRFAVDIASSPAALRILVTHTNVMKAAVMSDRRRVGAFTVGRLLQRCAATILTNQSSW